MKNMKQEINGYHMPTYMEDILTHNYCPNFLRMSMVKERNDYVFSYQTGRYRKLDTDRLDTYLKLVLLRTVITLNERNADWLIKSENYLLEPELVYSLNNNVEDGCVRLLFYPDVQKQSLERKIVRFADTICNRNDSAERELIDKFKEVAEKADWNRTRLFLDKNIMRLQARKELRIS